MAQSNADRTARTEKVQRATLNYCRRHRPAESAAGIIELTVDPLQKSALDQGSKEPRIQDLSLDRAETATAVPSGCRGVSS
jgi:hypothetical protein